MTPLDPAAVLGKNGHIARRLPAYESRPQQVEMADAVATAIRNGRHLLAEAGTGVGKSFAYLVPAILAAAQETGGEGKRTKIVVSTHTISLQEQLIQKDIPFLNAVLPVEFSAVLVKGRSNYISLRRLKAAGERSGAMFAEPEEIRQLQRLKNWSTRTADGSLSSLDFRPLPQVWDEVRSEHGNCLGRKCPTYDECHYYHARRQVWNADLLVVNHALFFSDLALRREGARILPDYDVLILDEAHTVEDVAGDHLGVSVSSGQFTFLFNKLYNDRQNKGLLLFHELRACQELVVRLRYLVQDFFQEIARWRAAHGGGNGRVRRPLELDNEISRDLRALAAMIRDHARTVTREEQRIELTAVTDRLDGLARSLDQWLAQSLPESVYWVEESGSRIRTVKLVCTPIEIGPVLRDELFGKIRTVILASATLSVGQNDFSFFRGRIGLTSADEIKLGSPFNYREQVKLILPDSMPDPGEQPQEYEAAVCDRIRRHVRETDGRAFVLFTSYGMLRRCAGRLTGWFSQENLQLLCQGAGLERTALLDKFRGEPRSVLFGTESFWQGVDVPGDALQNVIITKLPFSVPDHPLLEARVERIKERGGNPFMEYQVPEAAIKLRQGFGRLIRSQSDRGQVVILDPRIRTKHYGKVFLESLPECYKVIDRA